MHSLSPLREGRSGDDDGGGGSEINRDFAIVTDSRRRGGTFQVFSSVETMIGNLRIGEWISASELIFNLDLNNGSILPYVIIINLKIRI